MELQELHNEILSLQAYFLAGYNTATVLRQKLECATTPASPSRGLTNDQLVKMEAKRLRTIMKKRNQLKSI